jgi:membrane-bound lytic murein transglycosylase
LNRSNSFLDTFSSCIILISSETSSTVENVNNNNDFRNITVVKQINENEDVQISNLRIEKVWNKFVQEEVTKIVEEVHNSTESNNQENIYNKQNSTVNQNQSTENFNKSEFNYHSGNNSNTENLTVYNTFNNQQQGTNTTTQETEERINYREVTELVFNRIEEKLKTFSVTEQDIIILKHKILSEVTEIYEKRSKLDIQKSEEKMKKEMQDLFIKFLNS